MARNRYEGYCYCCHEFVPIGYGHFERHKGGWRIKCVKCASGRSVHDTDYEVMKVRYPKDWRKRIEHIGKREN